MVWGGAPGGALEKRGTAAEISRGGDFLRDLLKSGVLSAPERALAVNRDGRGAVSQLLLNNGASVDHLINHPESGGLYGPTCQDLELPCSNGKRREARKWSDRKSVV